jgi:hypothetical protein
MEMSKVEDLFREWGRIESLLCFPLLVKAYPTITDGNSTISILGKG